MIGKRKNPYIQLTIYNYYIVGNVTNSL